MKKILLVEADALNQLVMKGFLAHIGYEVITATTGKEAVDKATMDISFVFMDLGLPDWGRSAGIEATRKIRAKGECFSTLPIVILTSVKNNQLVTEAMEAGANDYLMQPVDQEELKKTINSFIGK